MIALIYMDHAATTMLLPKAAAHMRQYEITDYGNPSGNYPFAYKAKTAIEESRSAIAATINAKNSEIFFTSGGSEADNWALKGIFSSHKSYQPHIITSQIEHSAILNSCHFLEKNGCKITYVPVNNEGIIDLEYLEKSITKNTILISVMTANNEIGTIQPVREIAKIAHKHNCLFHTDAVQAYCHIPIDVRQMGIDLMSVSAHKCNGPKGIGFLYANEAINFESFIHGGGQERKKRAGTENVAAIAGFKIAAQNSYKNMEFNHRREKYLNDYMTELLKREIPDIKFNGAEEKLANNINCTIKGANAQSLITLLSLDNICISAGSACHSDSTSASHVLIATGLSEEEALNTIRITLGPENTTQEAEYVVNKIKIAAMNLRKR